jgi:hypothetical protein
MNRTVFTLHPNGTITETHCSTKDELKTLQEAVGGYIENVNRSTLTIHNADFKRALRSVKQIYCCEVGAGLPENPHFELTHERLRPDAPSVLTLALWNKYSYKVNTPVKGAIAFSKKRVVPQ